MLTFIAGFASCALLLVAVAAYRISKRESQDPGAVEENLQTKESVVAFTESTTGDRTHAATE